VLKHVKGRDPIGLFATRASGGGPWESPLPSAAPDDTRQRDRGDRTSIGILDPGYPFTRRVDVLSPGAAPVDPVPLPTGSRLWEFSETVLLYEFKDGIARYLATRAGSVPHRTLADLIAFNEAHAAQEMPLFRQEPTPSPDVSHAFVARCGRKRVNHPGESGQVEPHRGIR
jgi:hypothetical protein